MNKAWFSSFLGIWKTSKDLLEMYLYSFELLWEIIQISDTINKQLIPYREKMSKK